MGSGVFVHSVGMHGEVYAENKYVIEGASLEPAEFIQVVAKLGRKNTVVITTYRVW